jgi:hypothetical protein
MKKRRSFYSSSTGKMTIMSYWSSLRRQHFDSELLRKRQPKYRYEVEVEINHNKVV